MAPCRGAQLALWAGLHLPLRVLCTASFSECQNPLFMTHWYEEGGPQQSLNAAPTVRVNLRLCPAYNKFPSCCPQAFEPEQNLHFQYWREILESKLTKVRESRDAARDVEGLPIFNAASEEDIEQFSRAMEAYDRVLNPDNHAQCWAALLTYTAGMICFGCAPDWQQYIELSREGKITRVLLTTGTCAQLWDRCEDFGALTRSLKHRVMDSRLALYQSTTYENLDMFHDQQALCDWMHNAIAMHPFCTPLESGRESARPTIISRRISEYDGAATVGYDAVRAGKASGFDTTWNGISGWTGAAQRPRPTAAALCGLGMLVTFVASTVS